MPGHPDVMAWRGYQTVFIEYKSLFDRKGLSDDQLAWYQVAHRAGLATPDNYIVVKQTARAAG